ncbi:hypothetical protein Misp01_55620 [Microtetraspora sp. NBRC 13810]|nr:hypothetical protein Misp01_55620 [Microtetraspora sp. NBRC 13810]
MKPAVARPRPGPGKLCDPWTFSLVTGPVDGCRRAGPGGAAGFAGAPIRELSRKYPDTPWAKDTPDVRRGIARITSDRVHLHE